MKSEPSIRCTRDKGRLYLDWGCGGAWSRTISQLRREGWDVWGYEPSAEAPGDFVVNQRSAIGAQFDGIFSNNVIEHFRDPVGQFNDFHQLLKPWWEDGPLLPML